MEVAEPARRRPHPQGCNEEEDGRDAVFWSAASARNGAARGKNCGKRSAGRCGYEARGRLTSIIRGSVGCVASRKGRLQSSAASSRMRRKILAGKGFPGPQGTDYRKARRSAIKQWSWISQWPMDNHKGGGTKTQ